MKYMNIDFYCWKFRLYGTQVLCACIQVINPLYNVLPCLIFHCFRTHVSFFNQLKLAYVNMNNSDVFVIVAVVFCQINHWTMCLFSRYYLHRRKNLYHRNKILITYLSYQFKLHVGYFKKKEFNLAISCIRMIFSLHLIKAVRVQKLLCHMMYRHEIV